MNNLTTPAGWEIKNNELIRIFTFKSYLKTIGFVNAIAWEANRLNHHPDLIVSFNQCVVKLTTHDQKSLSEKDFILAAKINDLMA